MAIFYVDGNYVEDSKAALPLSDMAILRGYAVFDFLRTYNGKPFHLEDHLRRLQNSASILHLPYPWETNQIVDIVNNLLKKNNFNEANIRFIITGGDSIDSITPENKPRLVVMVTKLKNFPGEWYRHGVKVITTDVTRYKPESKSTNYIKAIMALENARAQDAIESIYVNEKNQLLEGTTSNFFVVVDGRILTPDQDILPGITRDVVIRLASQQFQVEQKPISRDLIDKCSEAFLTSSNKEVAPIIQIDHREISTTPGPVTRKVMELFRRYTASW
jgi:branched-chain amino acid aminotransferase